MNILFKSVRYLLHPLLTPVIGIMLYFYISPRFTAVQTLFSNTVGIALITGITPIIFLFFLKSFDKIQSIHIERPEEQRFPLLFHSGLLFIMIKTLIDKYDFPELYFFSVGLLFSSMLTLSLVLFKIKVNFHMIGAMAITTFSIALSIHFGMNQIFLIATLLLLNGMLATACLLSQKNNSTGLLLGILIGLIPQIVLFQLWSDS